MTNLPDPQEFSDPIIFLRESHKAVLGNLRDLEGLIREASQVGAQKSVRTNKEWSRLLYFFHSAAPVHERDEEQAVFPLLYEKLPHTGFQAERSSVRFLIEGHEALQLQAAALVRECARFLTDADATDEEASNFLNKTRELVRLYHEHIATEEQLIYSKANDAITPAERQAAIETIQRNHSDTNATTTLDFDPPAASLPLTNFTIGNISSAEEMSDSEAIGTTPVEGPDEEE